MIPRMRVTNFERTRQPMYCGERGFETWNAYKKVRVLPPQKDHVQSKEQVSWTKQRTYCFSLQSGVRKIQERQDMLPIC